ncbi:vitamin K epoxide reductase family protein [Streptacidiphilus monticola]|uniref:Vitamin K epoxide reductase family protein n=1 Tax=Streptacidiphilus monticola TaxID=2161674 RepID=A0ABW1G448_9ACTN
MTSVDLDDQDRQTATRGVGAGRAMTWFLIITSALGFVASFTLTYERFKLFTQPGYRPSCNLNPIISCGNVMTTHQAAVFGFPNPLLGIAGFAVTLAVGFGLLAGARYRRWYWIGLNIGTLAGLVLICWLVTQSLYSIGALCPYCMVVWAVIFPMFWYVTLHNLRHGIIPTPASWRDSLDAVLTLHWFGPLLWYLVIIGMVLVRFWSYWRTLV